MKRRTTTKKPAKKQAAKKKSKGIYDMKDDELLEYISEDPYVQIEYNGDLIEVPKSFVSPTTGKLKKAARRAVDALITAATWIPLGYGGYKIVKGSMPLVKKAASTVGATIDLGKNVLGLVNWVFDAGRLVKKIIWIPGWFSDK